MNEQSGEQFRQRATTLLLMSWALFEIVLVPVAKYVQDWRQIFLYFMAIPAGLICLLNYKYVQESPRFLFTKKQYKEMFSTLNKISQTNNGQILEEHEYNFQKVMDTCNPQHQLQQSSIQIQNYVDVTDNISQQIQKSTILVTDADKKSQNSMNVQENTIPKYSHRIYTYLDLVKFKSLRKITLASCIVMFFTQMIYYSTQYSLNGMGSDLYVNTLVVAGGETLAYLICNRIIYKLPRKMTTFVTFIISLLLCGMFLFIPNNPLFQTLLAGLIRLFNCGTLAILALFVEELYPTTVRSLGVGAQMSIGVAGSSLAPIVIDNAKKLNLNPLLATAIFALPALYLISFFRETKGQPLQHDIKELQSNDLPQIIKLHENI